MAAARKAEHMLARLYERINNKRRNFLHKTSAYYCSRYDLIFLERLRVANLTKNHRLASSILRASWYTFKMMCKYKANRMEEVELAYSSIDCSRCGHPVQVFGSTYPLLSQLRRLVRQRLQLFCQP